MNRRTIAEVEPNKLFPSELQACESPIFPTKSYDLYTYFSRKKEARLAHKRAEYAQKVHGLRAKLFHEKRHKEKIEMKKTYAYDSKLSLSLVIRTRNAREL